MAKIQKITPRLIATRLAEPYLYIYHYHLFLENNFSRLKYTRNYIKNCRLTKMKQRTLKKIITSSKKNILSFKNTKLSFSIKTPRNYTINNLFQKRKENSIPKFNVTNNFIINNLILKRNIFDGRKNIYI